VPLAGLEPARCFHHLILSQARLPIPPQGPKAADDIQRGGMVNAEICASSKRELQARCVPRIFQEGAPGSLRSVRA
jgi:hypothetical protein